MPSQCANTGKTPVERNISGNVKGCEVSAPFLIWKVELEERLHHFVNILCVSLAVCQRVN
jgi:hypothetical protein